MPDAPATASISARVKTPTVDPSFPASDSSSPTFATLPAFESQLKIPSCARAVAGGWITSAISTIIRMHWRFIANLLTVDRGDGGTHKSEIQSGQEARAGIEL